MTTAAIFPDALAAAIATLTAALDGRGESYAAGASVGRAAPETAEAALPMVQLDLDTTSPGQYPVAASSTIRVIAWHHTARAAYDLDMLCQALLLGHPGGSDIVRCDPRTGPVPGRDPDTGISFCFSSVAVITRGRLLSKTSSP